VLLVLGEVGVETPAMAHGVLLALSSGLIVAPPTMLTGLLDWRDLPPRTPKRKLANLHLVTMLAATAVFAASWFPAQAGYEDGRVHTAALILALAGEALLLAGGYLGGALVYVHGHRVLSQPQTPVREALLPRGLSPRPQAAVEPAGHAEVGREQHHVDRVITEPAPPPGNPVTGLYDLGPERS
jgi:uncharacterized membrane protein